LSGKKKEKKVLRQKSQGIKREKGYSMECSSGSHFVEKKNKIWIKTLRKQGKSQQRFPPSDYLYETHIVFEGRISIQIRGVEIWSSFHNLTKETN